jgi:hypothetical protein
VRLRLRGAIATAAAASAMLLSVKGDAHKPITSPFTFNEDVLPIVRDRCAGCHYPGGVAPMSLLTHADAVPWGESMRAELMAGHMPPWRIDSAAERFRNVRPLTGRELNVLLTWASGGTPAGDPAKAGALPAGQPRWPLGAPDLVLPMPNDGTLAADVQEQVTEFVVRPAAGDQRFIRAVDLLPGTPSIVRGATVSVRPPAAPSASGRTAERLVALWLPGDHPVPLDDGAGFDLPAGSELVVRVRYRKTWEHENRVMTDRSSLGVYFADDPAAVVEAVVLTGELGRPLTGRNVEAGTTATAISEPVRALAIYPDPDVADVALTVIAVRPDRSRETLIAFRPQRGWARRYWFREPIALPRGTRIEVRSATAAPLLPPGALPAKAPSPPGKIHLTLNVVPAL